MATPKVYKTHAIVLKRINLGEADKILTLYTPNLGKLSAIAKGVRRPKSKMGGHLELLTHCSLMLARGQNLDIITQSETISSFLPLRDDLWRSSLALYAAELVAQFTAEHVENYPIYRLFLDRYPSSPVRDRQRGADHALLRAQSPRLPRLQARASSLFGL